ncbi:biotin/lipoyl-containing protein [uncultured Acetobacterium sp.]|uniref:biotin/lipoyl-containing protein n=1 Tax=uncultured Acetobacterium sp. TaxID=217139 RepID=UPI0024243347|nr:biotin/lipoyl-containing protein [uncultured Acetobacterium sp.]MBU4540009.1 lipoyl domain-containing protein [Bacillota bacterium]MDP2842879.1 biotin/lipoyl-containing protein [Acetobacterium sp.]
MKFEIAVPEFAEGAEEINLRQWLVAVGDTIKKGDNIAEAATDKISIYIESPADGVLTAMLAAEDDRVLVGQIIGEIEG